MSPSQTAALAGTTVSANYRDLPTGAADSEQAQLKFVPTLREEELVTVADNSPQPHTLIGYIIVSTFQYIRYVIETTVRLGVSLPFTLLYDPIGAVSAVVFGVGARILLFFVLIFTIIVRIPFVLDIVYKVFHVTGRRPSLANLGTCSLFALSEAEKA